ncbi:MAG: ExbD/TolR family protein [Kiritimatiellia bacterium]|nr:biopolymer transporter ExbD [Lentisphaerota bacterium]
MKTNDHHQENDGATRWRRYRPWRRTVAGPRLLAVLLLNLVLLGALFMIFNSHIVMRPGINVRLPSAEFADGTHYNTMVLTITQEGLIFFNDERVLPEDLLMALQRAVHRNRELVLAIEADLRVQYGTIVRTMNLAGQAGIGQINLATRPTAVGEFSP